MKSIRERYQSDPNFRALVDMMTACVANNQFTPSEMREAAILACINYEMTHMRSFTLTEIPDGVESALQTIQSFAESRPATLTGG